MIFAGKECRRAVSILPLLAILLVLLRDRLPRGSSGPGETICGGHSLSFGIQHSGMCNIY